MPNGITTSRHRDLTLTRLPQGTLVVACDSCGSIGQKPADALQVPAYYCGRFTARVALMEVLAFGARPVTVANAVSCEMEPTGREIIRGVQEELAAAGVDRVALTGSTEENFPSQMTALGITVVGYRPGEGSWLPSREGDLVYAVGRPKVGGEIDLDRDKEIVSYEEIFRLRQLAGVREVIPVGSKGIRYEAENAARYNGLVFTPLDPPPLELEKSAGPATCLIALVDSGCRADLEALPKATLVGAFRR